MISVVSCLSYWISWEWSPVGRCSNVVYRLVHLRRIDQCPLHWFLWQACVLHFRRRRRFRIVLEEPAHLDVGLRTTSCFLGAGELFTGGELFGFFAITGEAFLFVAALPWFPTLDGEFFFFASLAATVSSLTSTSASAI